MCYSLMLTNLFYSCKITIHAIVVATLYCKCKKLTSYNMCVNLILARRYLQVKYVVILCRYSLLN